MKKPTIVYVDGLNLYHRLEETNPRLMWLNVVRLAEDMLREENEIVKVNYYTALFDPNSDSAKQQDAYHKALESQAKLEKHEGKFKRTPKYGKLTGNKSLLLPLLRPFLPNVLKFKTREEKKTDVALASHLVRDAFFKRFKVAVIVTNDIDFVEAIRVVTEELGLVVGILSPSEKEIPDDLAEVVSFHKHIRKSHLENARFSKHIASINVSCPPEWE